MAPSAFNEDYLQFLGHELRSPLTAVKTVLETLLDDLADGPATAAGEADARLRMVELALRNVQRLHRTVDWSQGLLALAHAAPPAARRRVALPDLLPPGLRAKLAAGETDNAEPQVLTDPTLCRLLLQQVRSVLEYDERFQVAGVWCTVGRDRITISLQALPRDGADRGRRPTVASTQLVAPRTEALDEARAHLGRLASYLVSGHLLASLDAELQAQAVEPDAAVLSLSLPAAA